MRVVAFAGIVVHLVAGAARGQTPEARRFHEEAMQIFQAGRLEEACRKFESGYYQFQDRSWLHNAAYCHEKAQDPAEAWRLYSQFVAHCIREGRDDKALEAVRAQLLKLEEGLRKTHGKVRITARPEGAQASVDGGPIVHATPVTLWLLAGPRRVELTLAGHEPEARDITVQRGGALAIDVDLVKAGTLRRVEKAPDARPADGTVLAGPEALGFRAPEAQIEEDGGVVTKWWFWTILGVGVTAAVVAPLGVVYGSPAEKTIPVPDWQLDAP